jgi:hypothetical protein
MAEDKTFKTFVHMYTYMFVERLYLFKFQFIQKGPDELCRIYFVPKNIALLYTEVYATCQSFFFNWHSGGWRPPLWSSGQSFWLQIQRSWVRFTALPDFLSSGVFGTGSTQPREDN